MDTFKYRKAKYLKPGVVFIARKGWAVKVESVKIGKRVSVVGTNAYGEEIRCHYDPADEVNFLVTV